MAGDDGASGGWGKGRLEQGGAGGRDGGEVRSYEAAFALISLDLQRSSTHER